MAIEALWADGMTFHWPSATHWEHEDKAYLVYEGAVCVAMIPDFHLRFVQKVSDSVSTTTHLEQFPPVKGVDRTGPSNANQD